MFRAKAIFLFESPISDNLLISFDFLSDTFFLAIFSLCSDSQREVITMADFILLLLVHLAVISGGAFELISCGAFKLISGGA